MKIRQDMNARTAMVYGGAAFLLVIVGFRSIVATIDPDHIGVMTYLSIVAILLEFVLLIFYAQSIYNLGACLLYTSPSPRDKRQSRMPSSA